VHLLSEHETWGPFPVTRHIDDTLDRHDAHRAIGVSAIVLALTGLVELAIAVLSGSVGLLGDALHNLSDVSTSAVVFLGFRVSNRPANALHPYGYEGAAIDPATPLTSIHVLQAHPLTRAGCHGHA
jgi:Co/Zn/Cd efflux system component